jgi:GAF domain-containing protein
VSEAAPEPETSTEPLGLREVAPDELFGVVCRDLAQYFDVPLSLVTITTSDPAFWKNFAGVEPERPGEEVVAATRAAPSVAVDELMVVEDITIDRRLAANQHLLERGIRFYGAAPLRNKAGRVVGSLSVVDTKPRAIGTEGERLLAARASELMEAVEAAPEEEPKRGRASNPPAAGGR